MAISSDVIRGYNDTMILYLLLDQPSYGYEISRQIKTLSHEKYIIKETTLYSAFTRMEKNGYITSFQDQNTACLLYTSPSPRDRSVSRMPSSA